MTIGSSAFAPMLIAPRPYAREAMSIGAYFMTQDIHLFTTPLQYKESIFAAEII